MIGSSGILFSLKNSLAANMAAFALRVSKIVSIKSTSTPPSTSPLIYSL